MGLKKRLVRYWHQLSSPFYFEKIALRCEPWCWGLATVLLAVGIAWGLFIAPADYQQKDAFRIIYIHVPVAALSMGVYVMMAIASAVYFIWHIKLAAYVCRSSAILGAAFTFLALVTGSIWGKPMWGTWWTWDMRLTSELILLFLYIGYIAVVSSISDETLGNKIGSILLIVGVINIPIIHYSVVWWNSLHQQATILKIGRPSISADMGIPLYLCLFGLTFYMAAYIFSNTRSYLLEIKNERILLERLTR